jgi:hypothetical protein
VAEDLISLACAHLEFFGYTIDEEPDGWRFARHPVRWTFHLRFRDAALRFVCAVHIGTLADGTREEWQAHVNQMNERAALCRFALIRENGADVVRIRAVFTGAYERRLFGMALICGSRISARFTEIRRVSAPRANPRACMMPAAAQRRQRCINGRCPLRGAGGWTLRGWRLGGRNLEPHAP